MYDNGNPIDVTRLNYDIYGTKSPASNIFGNKNTLTMLYQGHIKPTRPMPTPPPQKKMHCKINDMKTLTPVDPMWGKINYE